MKKLNKILISLASVVSISSLPMIAASCGAKKKEVEASNSEKQDSGTNSQKDSGTNSQKDSGTNSQKDSGTNSQKDSGTKSEKKDKNQEKSQNDGTTADTDKTKIDDNVLKEFKEKIGDFVTHYGGISLDTKNKAGFDNDLFMEIDKSKTKEDFENIKDALTQYAEGGILSDNYIAKTEKGKHILFGEERIISSWKNIEPKNFDSVTSQLIKKSEKERKEVNEKLDEIFKPILKTFE